MASTHARVERPQTVVSGEGRIKGRQRHDPISMHAAAASQWLETAPSGTCPGMPRVLRGPASARPSDRLIEAQVLKPSIVDRLMHDPAHDIRAATERQAYLAVRAGLGQRSFQLLPLAEGAGAVRPAQEQEQD